MQHNLYNLSQITKFIIIVLSIVRLIMEFIYKMMAKEEYYAFCRKKYK